MVQQVKKLTLLLCLLTVTGSAQFMEKISPISKESTAISTLLISYNALQIADCVTTYHGLSLGAIESNHLMLGLVDKPGILVPLKLCLALGTNFAVKEVYKYSPFVAYVMIIALDLLYSFVVYQNIHTINAFHGGTI